MTSIHVLSHEQTSQQFLKKTKKLGDIEKRINISSFAKKEYKANKKR